MRLAIAVGRDADTTVLTEFIGNPEVPLLQANNATALVSYIKWASTAVLKAASAPPSRPADAGPGASNVPIPEVTEEPGSATDVW